MVFKAPEIRPVSGCTGKQDTRETARNCARNGDSPEGLSRDTADFQDCLVRHPVGSEPVFRSIFPYFPQIPGKQRF
jgi:hypothetical protein